MVVVSSCPDSWFDITQYGASTSSPDNSAAIIAAYDAASAVGGTVLIPVGTWNVATSIFATGSANIQGFGGRSHIHATHTTDNVLRVDNASDCHYKDFRITGSAVARDADNSAFSLRDSSNCIIENLDISGVAAAGIYLRTTTRTVIRANKIYDNLAYGIHITDASEKLVIERNVLTRTGDDAIGLISYLADGARCKDIIVLNNLIEASKARGIANIGCHSVKILGNTIDASRAQNILVNANKNYNTYAPVYCAVKDNHCYGAGTAAGTISPIGQGIEVGLTSSQVTIEGNYVESALARGLNVFRRGIVRGNWTRLCGGDGIHLDASYQGTPPVNDNEKGLICTDNIAEECGGTGIYVEGFTYSNISGNIAVDCNTLAAPSIDNIHFRELSECSVTNNHSIDTRNPKLTHRGIEFSGNSANCQISGNSTYTDVDGQSIAVGAGNAPFFANGQARCQPAVAVTNSTTTFQDATGLGFDVGTGRYKFKFYIVYRGAQAADGIKFKLAAITSASPRSVEARLQIAQNESWSVISPHNAFDVALSSATLTTADQDLIAVFEGQASFTAAATQKLKVQFALNTSATGTATVQTSSYGILEKLEH